MFQKLKIFETLQHYKSSQIISDLKMANILTGIDRHNCKHSCYICDGLKDLKTGRWIVGDFRTTFTAIRDHNGFVASGENKRTAMDSNNQIREPIVLTSDLNKPFYQAVLTIPDDDQFTLACQEMRYFELQDGKFSRGLPYLEQKGNAA